MKIFQLSDTHFFADPASELWQTANPYQNFSKVISFIKKNKPLPDLLLLTGDLSQDDSVSSYEQLAALITSLEIPVYVIPGNHDKLPVMQQAFRGDFIKTEKIIKLGNWAFILLNSTKENWIAGQLAVAELDFLKNALQQLKNYQVMVVLHHHPIPIASPLMDQYILENRAEFLEILLPHRNIKTVLFGHVHQEVDSQVEHIRFLGCPATSLQFEPYASTFAVDPLLPGYRWLELQNENFLTGITRVE